MSKKMIYRFWSTYGFKLIYEYGADHCEKTSDWIVSQRSVISDNGEKVRLTCHSAEYRFIDNLGRYSSSYCFKIICQAGKILWLSFDNEPEYFVMKNKKMYGLSCHRSVYIYNNLDTIYNDIYFDSDKLDEIKSKYDNNYFCNDFLDIRNKLCPNLIDIDLTDHFYKGFFYKGFLWDRNWKGNYYEAKVIGFVGDYLKIEITNLTYPHTGYILLDIESAKVIEAGKYDR